MHIQWQHVCTTSGVDALPLGALARTGCITAFALTSCATACALISCVTATVATASTAVVTTIDTTPSATPAAAFTISIPACRRVHGHRWTHLYQLRRLAQAVLCRAPFRRV